MAGYHGYSMSNNAVSAYSDGEKPKSKWTKAAIMAEIQYIIEDEEIDVLDLDAVARLTKTELAETFLQYSSRHHTSKYYNKTDFYCINIEDISTDTILSIIANRPPKGTKPAPLPITYADIEYGVWEGPKSRLKLVSYTAEAIVRGNWAYTLNGERKSMNGTHLTILNTYDHQPQTFDTAAVARIKSELKYEDTNTATYNNLAPEN